MIPNVPLPKNDPVDGGNGQLRRSVGSQAQQGR
jgi:hypothetical protein